MEPVTAGENALGEYFIVTLAKGIYDAPAIMKACYALTDDYYIHVTRVKADDTLAVYFYCKKNDATLSPATAAKMFMDLLLENQLRHVVYQQTHTIREEIIKKAFSPVVAFVSENSSVAEESILISSVQ